MQHGDRERVFRRAVDRLADNVGGLVAVKRRGQHLDLEVHLAVRHAFQIVTDGVVDMIDVAPEVGKWPLPAEVLDDAAD